MFRFGDGVALWSLVLLPLLAALYWYASRRRQVLLDRFGEHELVRKLRPAERDRRDDK